MDNPTRTSFIAELHSITPGSEGRICASDKAILDNLAGDNGWLRIGRGAPLDFRFDYQGTFGDRIHYNVSCASDIPAFKDGKLGQSANGYLGLYGISNIDTVLNHVSPLYWLFGKLKTVSFWKVELLAPWTPGQPLQFHLRDDEGYTVAAYRAPLEKHLLYLNTRSGENVVFEAANIRVL